MEKIDFRIHANFAGFEVILSPSNQANREAIAEAQSELNELAEVTDWYNKELEKIESDKRLKDDTRLEKIKQLSKEYNDKTEGFDQKLPEYRKEVVGIMVDEWKGEQPGDDFYSNKYFDDFALNRFIEFFLMPKKLTPSAAQSNGSSR